MFFAIKINSLPIISNAYKIERKTVWSTVEPENILVFVVDGGCTFVINNKENYVKKGEYILIPAGQEYLRKPDDNPASFYYFHFITEAGITEINKNNVLENLEKRKSNLDSSIIYNSEERFTPDDTIFLNHHSILSPEAFSVSEKIIKEITSQKMISGIMISLYFTQLLALGMHSTVKKLTLTNDININTEKPVPPKIKKAVMYINQNYKKIITLKDLSDFCGITPQHIIRLFKSELGLTPTQYINRFKINYAKSLIRNNPTLSMKEISYELGFENPSYFSRLFTKLENESPSDFKIRINIPEDMYKSGKATVIAKSPRNRKLTK